jgi:hypothetical protein
LMEWKIQVYQEHFNSNFHNNHLYLQDWKKKLLLMEVYLGQML